VPRIVKTDHDSESLSLLAERLERAAAELRAIGAQMKARKFRVLAMTRHDQMTRGIGYIEDFAHDAFGTLHAAMAERGDYQAGSSRKRK